MRSCHNWSSCTWAQMIDTRRSGAGYTGDQSVLGELYTMVQPDDSLLGVYPEFR